MSEAGFLKSWMPKIGKNNILGRVTFQGRSQNTQITTINMYLLIEIRHDINMQSHGYDIEVKN